MRRSWLPVVLLQVLVLASSGLGGQLTGVVCRRATIESYPEDEKRPVLSYMDEVRGVADEFVRLLAESRFDEIYKVNDQTKIWAQDAPPNSQPVELDLAGFERRYGKIAGYEYRNQGVVYELTRPEIELGGSVATWYALKMAKLKGYVGILRLDVRKVGTADGGYRYTFEAVYFRRWRRDETPAWLLHANAPDDHKTCPCMEAGLKVKSP